MSWVGLWVLPSKAVPMGSLPCGQGQDGSTGPVAHRDKWTATCTVGMAPLAQSPPSRGGSRAGCWLPAIMGFRRCLWGGEFAFFPFKFPYLGFDRALWGPQCRLISFCVPFLMLHLVMAY